MYVEATEKERHRQRERDGERGTMFFCCNLRELVVLLAPGACGMGFRVAVLDTISVPSLASAPHLYRSCLSQDSTPLQNLS